jgi:hypothetical protein
MTYKSYYLIHMNRKIKYFTILLLVFIPFREIFFVKQLVMEKYLINAVEKHLLGKDILRIKDNLNCYHMGK